MNRVVGVRSWFGLGLGTALSCLPAQVAQAQLDVTGPDVTPGVANFEINTVIPFGFDEDRNEDEAGAVNFATQFVAGYGVTSFYKGELSIVIENTVDGEAAIPTFALENTFSILKREKDYPLDFSLFAAYEALIDEDFDVIAFGPIVGFQVGKVTTTLNTFFDREVGVNSADDFNFSYAAQSLYDVKEGIGVGVELFGAVPAITGDTPEFDGQELSIGPILDVGFGDTGLGANLGMQFGVTDATADFAFKLNLGYEID